MPPRRSSSGRRGWTRAGGPGPVEPLSPEPGRPKLLGSGKDRGPAGGPAEPRLPPGKGCGLLGALTSCL